MLPEVMPPEYRRFLQQKDDNSVKNMKLYGYFRSSASYRVRIALGLKGLAYENLPVNLLKAEQKSEAYGKLNPQSLLPTLIDDSQVLTQSLAIMEYLEETHPTPPLLPKAPAARARMRALCMAIACDVSPLGNFGVLQYLQHTLGVSDEQKIQWIQHWIGKGFTAVEALLQDGNTGRYCHGDAPGMADCVLVPQLFNARRFGCDLAPYPTIVRIAEACEALPAFAAAHPSRQPDAV